MRDWWYGDKRDVVKWGTIDVYARKHSISNVLQVALYRPDRPNYHLTIDDKTEPLALDVIRHFRDIDHIQRLAATLKLKIEVDKEAFQWRPGFRTREDFRGAHFARVASKVKQYHDPVIVFLDPDTGVAPENFGYEHVTPDEIRTVFRAMKAGDLLLFYQHARLGDGDWLKSTKTEFCEAIGEGVPVETVTCNEIANDVAFFVVERSKLVELLPPESERSGAG